MSNVPNPDALPDVPTPDELEALEDEVHFHTTRHGTKMAFHEYGDPQGRPLVFYHGTGSHVHGMMLHKSARSRGFRVIAPDRPGVAQSEFRPGWTVLDFAHDVADLADALGIATFGAVGISGAGPTLMASAHAIPERLHCVVDLACAMPLYRDPEMVHHLGTMDRIYAKLGSSLPLPLFEIPFSVLGFTQKILKSPETFAHMFDSSLCPPDKALFRNPNLQYLFMRDFQELFRHGAEGPAYDAQTVYLNWGFSIADISTHIEVFHGTEDLFVPLQFSQYLGATAQDVHLNRIDGQGHFYHLAYADHTLEEVEKRFYR